MTCGDNKQRSKWKVSRENSKQKQKKYKPRIYICVDHYNHYIIIVLFSFHKYIFFKLTKIYKNKKKNPQKQKYRWSETKCQWSVATTLKCVKVDLKMI